MVERTSEELMNYRFLPLATSEVFKDLFEDNPESFQTTNGPTTTFPADLASGARTAYNIMLHGTNMDQLLRVSDRSERAWSAAPTKTYATEFWFDAYHGGLKYLSPTYAVDQATAGGALWMANRVDDYHRGGRLWRTGPNPIGDLGDRNGDHRKRWWWILREANKLLKKADGLKPGFSNPGMTKEMPLLGTSATAKTTFIKQYQHPIAAQHKDAQGRHTPDLFVFNPDIPNWGPPSDPGNPYGNSDPTYWLLPVNIMKRLAYVHDQMYTTRLGEAARSESRDTWRIDQKQGWTIIRNVARGLALLEMMFQYRDSLLEAALQREEVALVAGAFESFQLQMLTDDEVDVLVERSEYIKYFSTTFNQDIITFVPIIHNFHLTSKYFQNITEAFLAPNNLALDILISTIKGEEGFRPAPNLSRPAVENTIANQLGQGSGSAAAARDFILKMLLMAPINILKGLCELIDPHVAISKLIKMGTGKAFNQLSTALDTPAETINETSRTAIREKPAELGGGDEAADQYRGIDGEDLLTFILCILDAVMKGLEDGQDSVPKNFFPRVKKTGVDFTGTVSGLLMIPPLPFGLIYLLLGLIKFGDDDAEDVSDAPPTDPEGCATIPEVIDIPAPADEE